MTQKNQHQEDRLTELELIIEVNQPDFYALGKALKEIRDSRLYLTLTFDTFEDYTKNRWDMRRAHSYRLIAASGVIDNLSPIGDILPKNEAQARPLTELDPFHQRKAWQEFLKSGMEQNARNIGKFLSKYLRKQNSAPHAGTIEIISQDYKSAVTVMLNQIRMAQNDRWRSTSREAALYWNKVMREKILWKS